MAVGPPATGTCHTMDRYGVGRWTDSAAQGGVPVMASAVGVPPDGPHTAVRWCHCTRAPYGMGAVCTVAGNTYIAAANTSLPDGVCA